jgi:hypothetical protein
MRAEDRFCRSCGAARADVPGTPSSGPALDDRTTVLPLEEMLAEPPTDAPALSLDSGAEPLHRLSTGRRATSFNEFQWLVLGTAVAVGVFINAVGL